MLQQTLVPDTLDVKFTIDCASGPYGISVPAERAAELFFVLEMTISGV